MIKETNSLKIIMLSTTFDDKLKANNVSTNLLERRLAACISCREIDSRYWWEGEIHTSKEFELLIKTNLRNLKILIEEIKGLHTYEEPEILYWHADTTQSYSSWIENTCCLFNN